MVIPQVFCVTSIQIRPDVDILCIPVGIGKRMAIWSGERFLVRREAAIQRGGSMRSWCWSPEH